MQRFATYSDVHGFTLIELLVVIALIVGLAGYVLAQSSNTRDVAKVEAAARDLESVFSYAQTMGRSGRFREGDTSAGKYDKGFGVYVTTNGTNAILYGGDGIDQNRNNPNHNKRVSGNDISTRTFEGGVTVSSIRAQRSNGAWTTNSNELHVLYRRGEPLAALHDQHPNRYYVAGELTLTSGSVSQKVILNDSGLVYSQ